MPARADRLLFKLAPFVSVFFALAAFASIPFGDTLHLFGRDIPLQAVTLNVGILYVLAMLSLGVYGLMMAGWASANNYALLGGQRAAALMISAEIAIGASIMGVVMVYGSLDMQDIARAPGPAPPAAALRQLDPRLGHPHPAPGLLPLPHRGHRRHQAHPLRHAGRRVRDHRLLRRVQRHEVRHVRDGRLPGDGGDRGHDHRAVPGRLAGALPPGDGLRVSLGRPGRGAAPRRGGPAGGLVPPQGRGPHLVPHAHPLDPAAVPLRPGDAAGLARALPAVHPQHRR